MKVKDKLLIRRLRVGKSEALRDIYEKYKNGLLKLAVVLTNDIEMSEDIVQDVFLGFARAAKFERLMNLKGYLYTSVVNNVRNRIRDSQRRRQESIEDANCFAAKEKGPEQWAILSEQLKRLIEAMSELPLEQREAVSLYIAGDLTFKQIANLQQTTISTVQGRFRYGIDKLRKLLGSEVEK